MTKRRVPRPGQVSFRSGHCGVTNGPEIHRQCAGTYYGHACSCRCHMPEKHCPTCRCGDKP